MAKTNTIPDDLILLDNKLVWCKNAKAGSSSMYFSVLPFIFGNGVGCQWHKKCRCYGHNNCPFSAWRLFTGDNTTRQAVMRAPSFLIIRNPWDRLRSTYVDRILVKKMVPTKLRKKLHPISFVEFVEHIEKYPTADIHWMPHSDRCLSVAKDLGGKIFHYNHLVKIEDGLFEQVKKIFGWYGLPFPEDAAPKNVNNETRRKAHNKDEEMREFYLEAATQKNVSMEALVEKVGKIYHLDVGLGRYTFLW